MSNETTAETPQRDYSLTGPNSDLAVENGLADAQWYASPVPRDQMRALLERRDGPAIRDTLIWFALLFGFGIAGYLLWKSWWAIVPFLLYGVIYASTSDSRWHESSHGTAFKTDWMNDALYEIASFMVLRESVPWRWSHTRHHSDTIIVGRDPEIALQRPITLPSVAINFINLKAIRMYVKNVLLHVRGRVTEGEATYIPASEYGKVFVRARIYLLIYLVVFGLALATRSILPLMYIGLPTLYGAWLMVVYGLTQHAGLRENVLDHRLNTRTVYMNRLNRYLYWNMGYHIEHHMFPMVPYHNLPKLHALVKADMPAPYDGLREAYSEIIPALVRISHDPNYYVERELPSPSQPADAPPAAQSIGSDASPDDEGWVVVCELDRLLPGEVLGFDHAGVTYAVYRTAIGQIFATEGICTHGSADLAEGFLQGTTIECPRHNGRFDIRDGSVTRPPPCIALKRYAAREKDGKVWLNVAATPGLDAAEAARTFRVSRNDNVAAFIKELVLVPDGVAALTYQPGEYLQFDIPPYPARSLADLGVPEEYAELWREQGAFDQQAANPAAIRRSYSMASNPAVDRELIFNVRLALAPSGVEAPAGAGSSYLFGLKPGDLVSAAGPFGDFHIQDTEREMVYVGAGSGMAPLRSHISHLFDTLRTTRRVSYWYGARSLKELYYEDYFEALARTHPNFSFHVTLSRPRPADGWTGPTGHIQEKLKREYLDAHPDPTQIEYYVCGPLPMVRAVTAMLAEMGVPPGQILSDEF